MITELDLPALIATNGSITVSNNSALTDMSFPVLKEVEKDATFFGSFDAYVSPNFISLSKYLVFSHYLFFQDLIRQLIGGFLCCI